MILRTAIRPRVGIPDPTLARTEYNARAWPQYAAAVTDAGGEPVQIPLTLTPAEIAKLATSCRGFLLPGSPADVNPAKYGQERQPETAEADPARENVDELLLQDAHNLRKPLLTLCYGTQSLNTWRTGTLVQDLLPMPVNHRADRNVAIAHTIAVERGSLLAEIVGVSAEIEPRADFLLLPVNSSHHQAIGIAGDGLRVVARCPQDGVAEAIEGLQPGHFVLGLQWHPERSMESSPASRLIFETFVRAAAAWQPPAIVDSLERCNAMMDKIERESRRRTPEAPKVKAPELKAPEIEALVRPMLLRKLPETAYDQLDRYLRLLIRWNSRMNLTAVRDPRVLVKLHIGESLRCAQLVPEGVATFLDFGSGAGLPGIPIQIARPVLAVTLAESQKKKAAFLREALRELNLSHTTVYSGLVEDMPSQQQFDAVAVRAVDRMGRALKAAAARVAVGGCLLVMTSEAETDSVRNSVPETLWESHPIPGTAQRVILRGWKSG